MEVAIHRGGGSRRAMAEDDAKLVFESSKGVEPIMTFDEMGINDYLLRGVYQHGFEKPSAIQQRAVLPIISSVTSLLRHNQDLLVCARCLPNCRHQVTRGPSLDFVIYKGVGDRHRGSNSGS